MELLQAVRVAAKQNNINGVMALKELTGLSYERTRRVWEGESTSKIRDIELVMNKLGFCVTYVKSTN